MSKKWKKKKKTEFETRNGRKWEMRRDKKHLFSTRNTGGEIGITGGNTKKQERKKQEKHKTTRNTETRRDKISGRQDFRKARQDFNEISGNAENGNKNKNEDFSNVMKQRFKSKNKVLVQA